MRQFIICCAIVICSSACSTQPLQQPSQKKRVASPHKLPAPSAPQQRLSRTLLTVARAQLGIPYNYGGNSPRQGFDCSGLVNYVHKQVGVSIPRSTRAQYRASTPVSLKAIQAGDLLFFNIRGAIQHVAIYLGRGRMIHAPSSGKAVEITSLKNPYWAPRLHAAGHF